MMFVKCAIIIDESSIFVFIINNMGEIARKMEIKICQLLESRTGLL